MAQSRTRAKGDDELVFETRKQRRKKKVTFTLDGEVFTCRPSLPAPVLYEHTQLLRSAAAMDPGVEANIEASNAILGFLKLALGDAEYERFWTFVSNPDRETDWDDLAAIQRALLKRYAARPTGPSSG